jgi:hypothetical protein
MLEADPRELGGEGDSALTVHLAACESCRVVAGQIVNGQLALARELETQPLRVGAKEALRRAESKATTIRRRNAFWQIGAPLVAAAGITGIVLLGDSPIGLEGLVQARVPETLPGLEVQGPPGKDVAVFEVADRPDVVVVWFFDAGDDKS